MPKRTLVEIYGDLSELSKTLNNQTFDKLIDEIKNLILADDEKRAIKDWKKSTGWIKMPENKKLKIEVYQNKKYPGIMIHRGYTHLGQLISKWSISHESSGLRISCKNYPNLRKAVKAFLDHAANVDWGRPENEILECPKARKAIEALNAGA